MTHRQVGAMTHHWVVRLGLLPLAAGLAGACEGSAADRAGDGGGAPQSGGFGDGGGGSSRSGGDGDSVPGPGGGLVPRPSGCDSDDDCSEGALCVRSRCVGGGERLGEEEKFEPAPERRTQAPAAPIPGDRYVFVPLPGAGALARIHLDDALAVDEIELRAEPDVVTTLPGRDVAVALTPSGGAIVIDATGDGPARLHSVPRLPRGLTHLTPSATTDHVVAWSDFDDLPPGGGNRSEVSVLDLSEILAGVGGPAAYNLSVGDVPRDVVFDAAGDRLLVVTDDGVSVVPSLSALSADGMAKPTRVHEDALAPVDGRRVVPTPDGHHAVVLQPGEAVVRLAFLDPDRRDEDPARLVLTGRPTDVAIVPSDDPARDGRRALVVVRERAEAVLLDLPADFLDGGQPEAIPLLGHPMGQAAVAPDGAFALLFTTDPGTSAVVQVDLADGVATAERARALRLTAPARSVAFAPSARTAAVFHADPADASAPAFTLLSFERRFFAKPFITGGAPAWPFVFAPADIGVEQLIVLLDAPHLGIRSAQAVPTDSFVATTVPLRARPVGVGLAPAAGAAFVTQDDPEGLLTFLDLEGELTPRDVSRFGRSRRID